MIRRHQEEIIQSGKYKLQKMTKPQVEKEIEKNGSFHGYLCGNKVNPFHIADGWHLGMQIDVDSVGDFQKEFFTFETSLRVHTPELGQYPHYYKIVSIDE